ncbi:MAG: hypothetical protein IM534_02395 [Chitinophagaceae bacterium]|nr:hypothetical protein [Chitinophagaceae bacterium]
MSKSIVLVLLLIVSPFISVLSQKKPLDHTVYDGWQSMGERGISNKGQWIFFAVNVQEGDGMLFVKDSTGKTIAEIARGYNAAFSIGQEHLVCRIRAPFAATREAKIKKKRPDEMPKDSLAIVHLSSGNLIKIAAVKQYALPEAGNNDLLVYWLDKQPAAKESKPAPDSLTRLNQMLRLADSLSKVSDSIRKKANELTTLGMSAITASTVSSNTVSTGNNNETQEEGTELIVLFLNNQKEKRFPQVTEWQLSKKGNLLVYEQTKKAPNSKGKNSIHVVQLPGMNDQTVLSGYYDAKSYIMDEAGQQLAFVAERDSGTKAVQRFYQLWHYTAGKDSARMLVNTKTRGVPYPSGELPVGYRDVFLY